jgi:hypothetical protein
MRHAEFPIFEYSHFLFRRLGMTLGTLDTPATEALLPALHDMYVCVRGGPNQPLHRDPQWSIVLSPA